MLAYICQLVFILYIEKDHAHIIFQHQTTALSWNQARDRCTALGLELAVIKDYYTWKYVQHIITTRGLEDHEIWFGLTWDVANLKFVWLDGDDLTYPTLWGVSTSEPNCMQGAEDLVTCGRTESYNQNCVRIHELKWKTWMCSAAKEYLCMKVIPDQTTQLPTSTEAVTLQPKTELDTTHSKFNFETVAMKPTTGSEITPETGQYTTTINYKSITNNKGKNPLTTASFASKLSTELETIKKLFESTTDFEQFETFEQAASINTKECIQICRPNSTRGISSLSIYKVDKKKTSLYLRRLYSAYDGRTTSRVIGWTGVMVLCLVAACIILIDLSRFLTKH